MTTFYFIRHGKAEFSEANTKIYQGWGFNMITLSPVGIAQIKDAAKDTRLAGAELIIASPYGRTMHTAAILSKELQLDIAVETGLHEWCANTEYQYLSDADASKNFDEFTHCMGNYPNNKVREWESAGKMRERVNTVLKKYQQYSKVIVVCHGTLMQYYLNIPHPGNGEIHEFVWQ